MECKLYAVAFGTGAFEDLGVQQRLFAESFRLIAQESNYISIQFFLQYRHVE